MKIIVVIQSNLMISKLPINLLQCNQRHLLLQCNNRVLEWTRLTKKIKFIKYYRRLWTHLKSALSTGDYRRAPVRELISLPNQIRIIIRKNSKIIEICTYSMTDGYRNRDIGVKALRFHFTNSNSNAALSFIRLRK